MRAHEQRPAGGSTPWWRSKAVVSAIAAIAIQVALIGCWAGAMTGPKLHEQRVGLVVAPGVTVSAAQLAARPVDAVTWRALSDATAARRAVRHGDLPAALLIERDGETLYLARAGGPITADALTGAIGAQAKAAGLALQVTDLRPPQSGDPRTLGVFVLILGWVVGGLAGAVLLARAHGARARTVRGTLELLALLAGYAVLAAALGVVLIDPYLGVMTGHAAPLIGVGALLIFTVGVFVTALRAVFGPAGLALGVGWLIFVGNPVSGAMVPDRMLPSGWSSLSDALPNTAGVRLVRAVTYFGAHGIADSLATLCTYAGASVLVVFGLALRRHVAPGCGAHLPSEPDVDSARVGPGAVLAGSGR